MSLTAPRAVGCMMGPRRHSCRRCGFSGTPARCILCSFRTGYCIYLNGTKLQYPDVDVYEVKRLQCRSLGVAVVLPSCGTGKSFTKSMLYHVCLLWRV
ncbi:hypothetical protein GDO81_000280 [Engystomops pustulosus]|uniref:Uncharacterized protein n=1 Tax=Engystomops pustulosus TaxID=76066 RepID=A0AAV7D3L2_ENGPU|nr:hypothetical protein GDO81_000280 [Engystomops pustulosus]